ncbi:MAG: 2-amino-4-hydroxy-6-hydroxymethyldihydropteridine diphosphokinase [Acidimicrobiales bacterium]
MSQRAFLGLGSNLGDRSRLLADAVRAIPDVVAVSPVYETQPLGGPTGQQPYLNLVVELFTEASPRDLLELATRLEAGAGRVRSIRWGPRTLDVDVLLVGDARIDEPDLVVPHPRMHERAFVLVPLSDLAPDVAEGLEGLDPDWRERAASEVKRSEDAQTLDFSQRTGPQHLSGP